MSMLSVGSLSKLVMYLYRRVDGVWACCLRVVAMGELPLHPALESTAANRFAFKGQRASLGLLSCRS